MRLSIILTCPDHCMNYSLLWPVTDREIHKTFTNTVTQHSLAEATLVVPSVWNVVILTLMYVISLVACNVEINCLHYDTYSLAKLHSFNCKCGMHLLLMSHAFACLVAYICLTKVSLFSLVTKALRDTDGPLVFSNLWRQRTPSRKTAATTFFHLLGEWLSEDSLWFICCQLKHRPQLFHTSKKTKSTHL